MESARSPVSDHRAPLTLDTGRNLWARSYGNRSLHRELTDQRGASPSSATGPPTGSAENRGTAPQGRGAEPASAGRSKLGYGPVADRVCNGAHSAVMNWLTDFAALGQLAHLGEPRFPNNNTQAACQSRSDEIRCGRTGRASPQASQTTRGPVRPAQSVTPRNIAQINPYGGVVSSTPSQGSRTCPIVFIGGVRAPMATSRCSRV